MYRVIIADDERIIREGISQKINWKSLGLELVDLAVNGNDALEKIRAKKPHIVITDIKMPGVSGLELIEKAAVNHKNTRFIILSGYEEFEFAKKAMKYGIKHYLLKPTNEEEITRVLAAVSEEIAKEEVKQAFLDEINDEISTMVPLALEQFLRDRVLNKVYSGKELKYYKNLIDFDKSVQLVLFELDRNCKMVETFALEKIIKNRGDSFGYIMSTFIGNMLLVLIWSGDQVKILDGISKVKTLYFEYYTKSITAALSSAGPFDRVHLLYQEAKEILNYQFYLGRGCTITGKDLREDTGGCILQDLNYAIEEIVISLKCGNRQAVEADLDRFFDHLKAEKLEKEVLFTYCVDLWTSIIRNNIEDFKQNRKKSVNGFLKEFINLRDSATIDEIKGKFKKIAIEIAGLNYERFACKKNRLVQLVLRKVEEDLGNEELNLKWLSRHLVFANVDYLSKIFKKEMGINFSQYLVKERVEKAKRMLENRDNGKIYEVAELVGFGDNSQYFSQVFKSYTGMSPSEYRKQVMEGGDGSV